MFGGYLYSVIRYVNHSSEVLNKPIFKQTNYYNISPKLLNDMENVTMPKDIISMIDDHLGIGECDLKFIHMLVYHLKETHRKLLLLTSKYYTRKVNGGIL